MKNLYWPGVIMRLIYSFVIVSGFFGGYVYGWRFLLGALFGFLLATLTEIFARIKDDGIDPFALTWDKREIK